MDEKNGMDGFSWREVKSEEKHVCFCQLIPPWLRLRGLFLARQALGGISSFIVALISLKQSISLHKLAADQKLFLGSLWNQWTQWREVSVSIHIQNPKQVQRVERKWQQPLWDKSLSEPWVVCRVCLLVNFIFWNNVEVSCSQHMPWMYAPWTVPFPLNHWPFHGSHKEIRKKAMLRARKQSLT